jgi:hypothetical protein
MNDLKKFRVTFNWCVHNSMSRVIEAESAADAEQIAESLSDSDDGWEHFVGEGVDGSDETEVEELPETIDEELRPEVRLAGPCPPEPAHQRRAP